MNNLHLISKLSPGDTMTLTIAVESLHQNFPGEYITSVETTAMEIWENNPWITPKEEGASEVHCKYPTIHSCNQIPYPFCEGYTHFLSEYLQRPFRAIINRPCIYLSNEEKEWTNQISDNFTYGKKVPFFLVNAGCKRDYTIKQWPVEYYQKVVDATSGYIQWVQIGAKEHDHNILKGVINLVGKTSHRELIRLVYHSRGGLGPVTYLQHLCAAFEKPYFCLVGGREPITWITYPKQHTFHTIGALDCCKNEACWKSRVIPLKDKDDKNNSLCQYPNLGYIKPVAKCMAIIKPEEIIRVLMRSL